MNEFGGTPKPTGQQVKDATDNAAGKIQDGIRSTQQATDAALGKASEQVEQLRSDAGPAIDKASEQTQKLMQQGRDMVNDALQKLRDEAAQASDTAVAYTKDEPIKAMLIAAATGALLMGLLALVVRSRD